MPTRFLLWLLTLVTCLDQLGQVLVRGPKYVIFSGPRPSADETISHWIGQAADDGKRWAILARKLIDGVLGQGHCQRSISNDGRD